MRRKLRIVSLIFIVAVTVLVWGVTFYNKETQGVLGHTDLIRLHVIANSDSLDDQELKLRVRCYCQLFNTPSKKYY
jgi:hypothetical protein